MKTEKLLELSIEELEEREATLWKAWETTRNVLKVVKKMAAEEE